MTTQYTYAGIRGGRPEDQFINFLIEQKVFPFVWDSLPGTSHIEIPPIAEVAAEEAGPWRPCD